MLPTCHAPLLAYGMPLTVACPCHHTTLQELNMYYIQHILSKAVCAAVVCCPLALLPLQELAHLDQDHISLIKMLMHGSKQPQQRYSTAPWLFDVVSHAQSCARADPWLALLCTSGVL